MTVGRDNLVELVEALLEPLVLALTIWLVSFHFEGEVTTPSLIASLLAFALTFPGRPSLQESAWHSIADILVSWFLIAALIVFFGYATRSLKLFPREAIIHWLWLGLLTQIAAHLLFRLVTPWLYAIQGRPKRAIIVGMNEQGIALAERTESSPYSNLELVGFFDDRARNRLPQGSPWPVIGKLADLARYAKENRIDLVYLSLPMATQPRILNIIAETDNDGADGEQPVLLRTEYPSKYDL